MEDYDAVCIRVFGISTISTWIHEEPKEKFAQEHFETRNLIFCIIPINLQAPKQSESGSMCHVLS